MSYQSFDPREIIRDAIGYSKYMNGNDESTVSVQNDIYDTIYLPLLLPGEARGETMRELPFIEMTLVSQPVGVHNVQGDVRDQEAYIDFNIYYANTDNITPTTWGKTIADELVDKIMEHRHVLSGCTWVEVINDGREIIEEYEKGKSVIFHRVVEVYCKNYDSG